MEQQLDVAIHFKTKLWNSKVVSAPDGADLKVFNEHCEVQADAVAVNANLDVGIFQNFFGDVEYL